MLSYVFNNPFKFATYITLLTHSPIPQKPPWNYPTKYSVNFDKANPSAKISAITYCSVNKVSFIFY